MAFIASNDKKTGAEDHINMDTICIAYVSPNTGGSLAITFTGNVQKTIASDLANAVHQAITDDKRFLKTKKINSDGDWFVRIDSIASFRYVPAKSNTNGRSELYITTIFGEDATIVGNDAETLYKHLSSGSQLK